MAEFVAYWQAELEKVVDTYAGTPVPFGRTKEDPVRIGAIEEGRHTPIAELMQQVHDEIAVTRGYLPTLRKGRSVGIGRAAFATRRDDRAGVVERFTVAHLEEHADQLDRLR
jgi:hypothetical protein